MGGTSEKTSQMKIETRAQPDWLPCRAALQNPTLDLSVWPVTITCPPLSLLTLPHPSRKMILNADRRSPRIRGGDSQVPSESFVTEVISEAPLTLNYIS